MNKIRIPRILAAIYGQPWAVLPSTLSAIKAQAEQYASTRADGLGYEDSDEDDEETIDFNGRVGLIRMDGIICQHLSMMETACGGYDLAQLSKDLRAMANNASVEKVLLVVRSPGGTVTGVPEAAVMVDHFNRAEKPIVAMTDDMAASAAYWIASQASEVWITPSSEVGSIGVYSAVVDESAAWAKDGYKLELMKAGAHKAAGIPGIPLSNEDRDLIQAEVDELYSEFKSAVLSGRKREIADSVMQGQMFRGEKAYVAGLADRVVLNVQDAVDILNA